MRSILFAMIFLFTAFAWSAAITLTPGSTVQIGVEIVSCVADADPAPSQPLPVRCARGLIKKCDKCFGQAQVGQSCAQFCSARGVEATIEGFLGRERHCALVAGALGIEARGDTPGVGFGSCGQRTSGELIYSPSPYPAGFSHPEMALICECAPN